MCDGSQWTRNDMQIDDHWDRLGDTEIEIQLLLYVINLGQYDFLLGAN